MATAERNRTLIHQYFHELWKGGDLIAADTLLAPDVAVRGSLGITVRGPDGFRTYLRTVQTAFPDLRVDVEGLIAEGDRVAARVRYSGTHLGPLFGLAPSGRAVSYPGITLFRVSGGRIVEIWSIGDTLTLVTQVGIFPDLAGAN
ncbi:MAG: ester cyclase [Zavarzinella sp.]|nr:ester cyclase [Zavarzinella sp.]